MRVQRVICLAPYLCCALAVIALTTCTRTAVQGYPQASNCPIQVYETRPGPDHVEVGQFELEDTYLRGQHQRPHKRTDALLAEIGPDICSLGGDMLVIRRNAAGEIVQGTVYRRANVNEVSPPDHQLPPAKETCGAGCGAGFTCEQGSCIPQCTAESCAQGESCAADGLCHANS
jgi:hypothetical protein